ncbi:MAG: RluA family pseudouridine synthase [Clostridiales bacterium]|nr:RluA family pseudouridine synthase [Clostridiales bacterium]
MNNEVLIFNALTEDIGIRLDAFIGMNAEDLSRSYAVQLIENGLVTVNNNTVKSKKFKISAKDEVRVSIPYTENFVVQPENISLNIVYEDNDILVVNKPRGMVVHPAPGNYTGTLVNALIHHCGKSLSDINGALRPGIVHRIDKDTSGLLVVAKNNSSHEVLASQLQEHSITREYTALVHDNIRNDDFIIDEPIGRDEKNRLRKSVNGSSPREAVTHIKVKERFSKFTLVIARLETGRTHQIRVHMAYIKHPLVGDPLYGPKKAPTKIEGVALNGQLLHAGTLGFIHPSTGKYIEFTAPLPETFSTILEKLRQQV